MDRAIVILLLAAAAFSVTVSAHDDDPWFPGWGWSSPPPQDATPPPLYPEPSSPYYPPSGPPPTEPPYYQKDVPVEELFEDEDSELEVDDVTTAPSYSSGPSYSSPYGQPGFESAPSYFHGGAWMTDRLVENPDQWPEPWTPTTTVEEAFGTDAEKVYGSVSLLDGLSSKGDDGYSKLLKEGITALLNAIDKHFKIAEDEIKKAFSFKTSLASEDAAAQQANFFAEANADYAASHN